MSIFIRALTAILFIVFVSTPAWSGDIKGSSDHPETGRFADSIIYGYKQFNFNEYLFPEGEAVRNDDGVFYTKSSVIEGKVTRIYYVAPLEASVAEVARNYEKQLEKKGYEQVFKCRGEVYSCGYWMTGLENFQPELVKYAYQVGENRYASYRKAGPKGDIYVSILVFNYVFDHFKDRFNHPVVQLDVIEAEALNDEQIEVVTADTISSEVEAQGRIALYGIYFDTDKADIKPESGTAIEEIYKALTSSPDMKLHVVGHTDNTGSFDHNMKLSKARADAVVTTLVNQGVDADRLRANGVASLAPVASNSEEDGRAKNRRVELVAQ